MQASKSVSWDDFNFFFVRRYIFYEVAVCLQIIAWSSHPWILPLNASLMMDLPPVSPP